MPVIAIWPIKPYKLQTRLLRYSYGIGIVHHLQAPAISNIVFTATTTNKSLFDLRGPELVQIIYMYRT